MHDGVHLHVGHHREPKVHYDRVGWYTHFILELFHPRSLADGDWLGGWRGLCTAMAMALWASGRVGHVFHAKRAVSSPTRGMTYLETEGWPPSCAAEAHLAPSLHVWGGFHEAGAYYDLPNIVATCGCMNAWSHDA